MTAALLSRPTLWHRALWLAALLTLAAAPTQPFASQPWVTVEMLVIIHQDGASDVWPAHHRSADLHQMAQRLPDPAARRWQASGTARSDLSSWLDGWPGLDPATRQLLFDRLIRELPVVVPSSSEHPPSPAWPDAFIHDPQGFQTLARSAQRLSREPGYRVVSRLAWRQPLVAANQSAWLRVTGGAPLWLDWLQPVRGASGATWRIEPALGLHPAVWQLEGQLRLVQRQFTHVELDLIWREPATTQRGPLRPEFMAPQGYAEHRLVESRTVQRERIEYIDSGWLGVLLRVTPWRHPLEGIDLRPPDTDESTSARGPSQLTSGQ